MGNADADHIVTVVRSLRIVGKHNRLPIVRRKSPAGQLDMALAFDVIDVYGAVLPV